MTSRRPIDGGPWGAIAARACPGATPVHCERLAGGVSSCMTAVDVLVSDRTSRRLVVRTRAEPAAGSALSIEREFRLVERLHACGLPVPEPVLLDESGDLVDQPVSVFSYVDGAPQLSTASPEATGVAYADLLVQIHDVAETAVADLALPDRVAQVRRCLEAPPARLDDALQEERIRAALVDHGRRLEPGPRRLLHGDLWPGNVVWHRGALRAVIDWEDAAWGHPLADVAVTRLDLLWAFGPAAMASCTARYLDRTGLDPSALAVWDLVAALRPAGALPVWAADWHVFGRHDVTAATMRAAHQVFVEQALSTL